eukprot:CAMPEP_0172626514 /NCGR_PEP_ID=MMETSP1068-20121228/150692_1 /TAXON_ID=35684 /ORGANISM="Pseudopedinella elastica, Strain CCMP716" /LENGTH=278 /DNA_ID=CAMNT_0013436143 /DNA_START=272 /DNA_END=1108 /DNA_ORIENTATION=+
MSQHEVIEAYLYPAVSNLEWVAEWKPNAETGPAIDWATHAFDDLGAFWMRILALMTDLPLRPMAGSNKKVFPSGGGSAPVCHLNGAFGLPSVEHPSPPVVRRFAKFLRSRLGLSPEPVPCDHEDIIGFVKRTNRRIILNEVDLAEAVELATGARVRWLDFGSGFDLDVGRVQDLRVMVGGQGSGLTNGLYLPSESPVVILYQYGGWDVFEEFLKPRGPLLWWTNSNASASVCNQSIDPLCDSPDTLVDIPEALAVIVRAFELSKSHCNKTRKLGGGEL